MTDSANLRVLTALRTIFSALNQANSLSTSRAASPFALPSQLNGLANGATVRIFSLCTSQSLCPMSYNRLVAAC